MKRDRLTGITTGLLAIAVGLFATAQQPIVAKSLLATEKQDDSEEGSHSGGPRCGPYGCPRPVLSADVPHIVSPRSPLIVSDDLVLHWAEVEGISSYTVSIRGPGIDWQADVEETFVTYNGDPLQPGGSYILSVNANNGEPTSEMTFWVATSEQKGDIEERLDRLDNSELSQEEQALARSQIYREEGFLSDAIAPLLSLAETRTTEPEVYCQLSELYYHLSEQGDAIAATIALQVDDWGAEIGASCHDMEVLEPISD